MGNFIGKKSSKEVTSSALLNTPASNGDSSLMSKKDHQQADIRVADVLQKTSKILGKRARSSKDETSTSYAFLIPKRRRSTRDAATSHADAIDELEATIKHLDSLGNNAGPTSNSKADRKIAEKSVRGRKVRERIANTLDELRSLTLELEKRDHPDCCRSSVKHAEVLEMTVKHMATFVGQSSSSSGRTTINKISGARESEVDEKVTTTTTTITTLVVDNNKGDIKDNNGNCEAKQATRVASCLGELKGLLLEALQMDATQKIEGVDLLEMTVKYLRNNIGRKVNSNNNMCGRVVETSV